jgi:hypothetical protein
MYGCRRTGACGIAVLVVLCLMGPMATQPTMQPVAQGRLPTVTKLRCTFKQGAVGGWQKSGAASAAVRPATLMLRLEGIDIEAGSAQVRSGAMTSEITVKQTGGYLHFMQTFKGGALYTTTVFDTPAGPFKAVHSRHEYFTVPVPGATSSPEQYYGECRAE